MRPFTIIYVLDFTVKVNIPSANRPLFLFNVRYLHDLCHVVIQTIAAKLPFQVLCLCTNSLNYLVEGSSIGEFSFLTFGCQGNLFSGQVTVEFSF